MPHPQSDSGRRGSASQHDDKKHDDFARFEEYWSRTGNADCAPALRARTPDFVPPPRPATTRVPNLPSDWWHSDTNIRIVNGTGNIWYGDNIPFFPDHGPAVTGVALTQALLGVGLKWSQRPINGFIHELLFHIPHPMLAIQWPGYSSASAGHRGIQPITIERPLDLSPTTTVAEVARQVADCLVHFAYTYADYCDLRVPNALLLGPGGVSLERLRLVKLWTSDRGLSWKVEVAVVDDYVDVY
ncbi:hypothetical protein C8R46DRAFT_1206315 [Mycena filopes]|nr:hypothetical protein C8R46DRAFT_1206315 [Mycena filopes]